MITSKDQFIQQREMESMDDAFEDSFTKEPNNEKASMGQISYLESLLSLSVFDEDQRRNIACKFDSLSVDEATKLIEHLRDNQQDKFRCSGDYTQKELNTHLLKISHE